MADLTGKVAIVTGAARGLGAATARRLCADGAAVMLTDILAEGEATAQALRDEGFGAAFRQLDVADAAGWAAVVEETAGRFGGIDILVNNAGVWVSATIETVTVESLRRVHDINFVGPMIGMQAVIPQMRARGGGAIVNICSNATQFIFAESCSYGTSKAALAVLTKTTAVHCAQQGYNIRANSIHPGPHETAMMGDGSVSGIALSIPMKRMGKPEEVASAVSFLASDDASFITATELFIDGGMTVV